MNKPIPTTKLTKTIFAEGIAMISDRWNRDVAASTSAVMAEWLAEHQCTGDEFIAGVKRAIAEDEWPPSAKRILELARPVASADVRAGEVFEQIRGLGRYIVPHGTRWEIDEIERECGEAARRALISIGGPRRLVDMTDDAVPFVLRDFAKAFAEFDRELSSRATTVKLVARGEARRQLHAGAEFPDSPINPKGE